MINKPLKEKIYNIVFENDTPAGKRFDVVLIIAILFSILVVILESVPNIKLQYGNALTILEWVITAVFTMEYILRILIVRHPMRFIFSFFGIIDLLSLLPTYLGLFFAGAQGLMAIRALRLLRLFRILKLNRYLSEGNYMLKALVASRYKISIFLYAVLMLVIVLGAIMHLIEGESSGFDSIPRSMYWVIVTITTVGYGDITPITTLGQFIASFIMILGFAIIAVPTGIVSAEMNKTKNDLSKFKLTPCSNCTKTEHENDALFCNNCGTRLKA